MSSVENNTGEDLQVTGCGSPFQVRLHNEDVRDLDLSWQDCREHFTVPTGVSRWPVYVPTILLNPDGVIPPGAYTARIHQNTTDIPTAAVDVEVVQA